MCRHETTEQHDRASTCFTAGAQPFDEPAKKAAPSDGSTTHSVCSLLVESREDIQLMNLRGNAVQGARSFACRHTAFLLMPEEINTGTSFTVFHNKHLQSAVLWL